MKQLYADTCTHNDFIHKFSFHMVKANVNYTSVFSKIKNK